MLPRQHRLTDSRSFAYAVRNGRRIPTRTVVAHLVTRAHGDPAAPEPPARVGLIVSKRVGNSVQRHRVSRRLRHAVARDLDRLPPGSVLVLRALPAAAAGDADLPRDVSRIMSRIAP